MKPDAVAWPAKANQQIEYLDIATGELRSARNAGDPLEFMARTKAMAEAEQRGERPTAKVDCNGCKECCYHSNVDFNPANERPEDLA